MVSEIVAATGRVIAFMDIGTNSVRVLLVRINPNHSYQVITQHKESVRLGEGEFADNYLRPEAMRRAVLVCHKFVDLARSFGAEEIIAVATSATREAENQAELLEWLHRDEHLDVRVISGLEEARLIYLGIVSGVHLDDAQALFIDIGGGSTEIIAGNRTDYHFLESLRLGAIRLTALYRCNETGPIHPAKYAVIKEHVRNTAIRTVQRLQGYPYTTAFGCSGTIENLTAIAARAFAGRRHQRGDTLTLAQLRKVAPMLCALPLDERRKVPGLNPERADLIIAGAAIVEGLMEELTLREITFVDRGLRDGLVIDYLARSEYAHLVKEMPVRERSLLQLGRNCRFDEGHARTVARLALELYDSAQAAGLHALGEWPRALLEGAALLHDVGSFLSFTNHEAHSYYMIRNAELLGFDQKEIAIMATTALFHRKPYPTKKSAAFAALDEEAQDIVRVLCVLLRLAESLDRVHADRMQSARLEIIDKRRVALNIRAATDCQLEIWGIHSHQDAIKRTFGRSLEITVACDAPQTA